MAPKKKSDADELAKAEATIRRAKNALAKGVFGQGEQDWERTVKDVDATDKEFNEEEVSQKQSFADFLRKRLREGKAEVRVMQIGPRGELTDVSDRVKPQDLRPEDIGGVQTEDGRTFSIGRNPQSREVAYRLLQDMLGTSGQSNPSGKSESIRRMELILEESDKLLEHWKK